MDALPQDVVLAVNDLRTHFVFRDRSAKSVDGVTFTLKRGQTLAVVGESGSGKSVTSLSVMRLLAEPGRIVSGSILFRDRAGTVHDLARLDQKAMRRIRGREIAMIFQEPMTSLNPLYTVGDQIAEMAMLHEGLGRKEALGRARQMLELVEIPAAASRVGDYPHQMSGGMRQRVMIALALSCNPSLLIADEPTTALDVTIQAQILDLLLDLQRDRGMALILITHDMGVVAETVDRVVVQYAGQQAEAQGVQGLFADPMHPYTAALLAALPERSSGRLLPTIPGVVPGVLDRPAGCLFSPRCGNATEHCRRVQPAFGDGPRGRVRCHYPLTGGVPEGHPGRAGLAA